MSTGMAPGLLQIHSQDKVSKQPGKSVPTELKNLKGEIKGYYKSTGGISDTFSVPELLQVTFKDPMW